MKKLFRKSIAILLLLCLTAGLFACEAGGESSTKSIVISEVVTSNGISLTDETYGSPDWIELHNESDAPINLFGWSITDNVKNSEKACILPEVIVPAGGYLVLLATKLEKTDKYAWDGTSPICLGFSLKSTGETLVLTDPYMQTAEEIEIPALYRDYSYARRDNGSFGFCIEPTPNAPNTTPITNEQPVPTEEHFEPVTGIEINEVSSRNTQLSCGGCESCDWIELHNRNSADIVLDGFTICDDPSDFDDENLSGTIPANGYLLIYCCKEDCATKDAHVCVKLGVSRYGDHLYLYDNHGNEIDAVEVPEMPEKDMTYARRDDGTFGYCIEPTPNEANHTQIFDEPPVTEAQQPETTEKPEDDFVDPTQNAVRPSDLRISEVLPKNAYSIADRDGDRSDWVELINTSGGMISLAGWYLSDNPKNLMKWAFPEDATLQTGAFYLVFLSGKLNVTGEIHASFSISAGETLYLYNAKDGTLDWVTVPELPDNVSIGLDENNEQVYYRYPTPMAPNGHAEKTAEALGFFPSDGVYISEVCAIHKQGSSEKDWIEFYNGGTEAVSLDGWYLSDSVKNLQKYRISALTVNAGAYAVVEDEPFGISPNGETLYLSDPDGVVRDVFQTGVQRSGMSSGRIEGDSKTRRVFFTKKTKGEPNSTSLYRGYTSDPTFSVTDLYHKDSFSLTLSSLDPSARIYYTTNGSEPSEKSKEYSGPISISKNTVIRAIAVSDGLLDSSIITYHYLFVEPHTVPVVCIAIAPDDFKTVYNVSVHRDLKGTERKAYFNYYESDGKIGVCFPAELRCKGQGTLKYKQKSFSVHMRGEYGMSKLEYPLFPDYPYTTFGALNLRNGGQDQGRSRFIDSFVSRMSIGMNVEVANSRCTVVYINGTYYGIYELGEDLNADFLENHYGADKDKVDLVRYNGDVATHGSSKEFVALRDSLKKVKLTSESDYAAYLEKVDETYFIDYIIARTYACDTDMINQKHWRVNDGSIKWRPLLFDMDLCFRQPKRTDVLDKYFSNSPVTSPHGYKSVFYLSYALGTNPGFRQRFVERYVEILYTQYDTDRLLKLLDEFVAVYEPEMPRQIAKWGEPSSMKKWNDYVNDLRDFIKVRRDVMINKLKDKYKISDSDMNALIAKYSNQ